MHSLVSNFFYVRQLPFLMANVIWTDSVSLAFIRYLSSHCLMVFKRLCIIQLASSGLSCTINTLLTLHLDEMVNLLCRWCTEPVRECFPVVRLTWLGYNVISLGPVVYLELPVAEVWFDYLKVLWRRIPSRYDVKLVSNCCNDFDRRSCKIHVTKIERYFFNEFLLWWIHFLVCFNKYT